ncbi:MAG: hypothetical protein GXX10_11240 [Clostridiaceae bacterium]|nr:hypothetical protein [Clostridiaceae bacterium]
MLDKKQLEKIKAWEQEPLTLIGVFAKEAAKTALAYRAMLERVTEALTNSLNFIAEELSAANDEDIAIAMEATKMLQESEVEEG